MTTHFAAVHNVPPVDALTLEQCAGQVLCCGWEGEAAETVNPHARELVEEIGVGAVMLLGRNVGDPDQTRSMLTDLRRRAPIPLLVAIDHEGGAVCRFANGLHVFPGNMALGAIADDDEAEALTERQANVQGAELRAVGIDWNCAPVSDVNSNPQNPVIGVRSFGESPERVGLLVRAAIRGFHRAGVRSCAKHFPGHGDTAIDSHLGLPTVARTLGHIERTDLVPFRAAIAEGVNAVMTSHILFSDLDPDRPATCSPSVLTGLLRERLQFDGLIITDCLEMAAIAETIGSPTAAVQALRAGADMVLLSHTLALQHEALRAITLAVCAGVLPEARLREAAARVLRLKRQAVSEAPPGDEPWVRPEHADLEDTIAAKSITRARGHPAPLRRESPIAVLSLAPAADVLAAELRARGATLARSWSLDLGARLSASPHMPQGALSAHHVVLLTDSRPWLHAAGATLHRQAEIVRHAFATLGDRLTVVAVREPYDIVHFPEVTRYLCCYSTCGATMRALAAVLLGDARPDGRLPVTLPATN